MKNIAKVLLALCWFIPAAFAAKIPSEHFGHLPMFEEVELSPDGNNIAAVYNSPDGAQVVIAPFGSREITPIVKLEKDVDRIEWIRWQNNDRLLIASSFPAMVSGYKYRASRLYTVTKDGKGLQEVRRRAQKGIVTPDWVKMMSTTNVLTLLPDDPDHILMQLYSERDGGNSVFKVNPEKNTFDKVLVNKLKVNSWTANSSGIISFGARYRWIMDEQVFETIFYYRKTNEEEFKEIYRQKQSDPVYEDVIASYGDKIYIISDREISRKALWLFDIATAKYEKILYSHEKYDIKGALFNSEGLVEGVFYADDYVRAHYFNDAMSKRQQFIDNSLKGYINRVVSSDDERNRVIVEAQRNDKPSTFYWMDIKNKKGGLWFTEYPYLINSKLGQTGAFSFKASDGLEISGYLTMPPDGVGKKPKLIVHPHGGPQSRDYQYFNPWVQFMVSRGYAVLQVNFRGSSGFGSSFEVAGYQQWGKRMQQDIYDAVDWLKGQDIVDAEKACIVGGSYGGYVALTAAFQKPNMFQCIVSIAGIPDLYKFADDDHKTNWLREITEAKVGNPDDDKVAAELQSLSAINNLKAIKKPILLIHGTNDTRVNYEQSKDFYEEAKSKGLKVEYLELKYGTHYLNEGDNRKAAFKAIDAFLEKYL